MVNLICSKCKQEKHANEFSRSKYSASGFRSNCKECERARCRAQRAAKRGKAPPAPPPVEDFEITEAVPVLEQVHAERAQRAADRSERVILNAAVEENKRLRAELDAIRQTNAQRFEILVYDKHKSERVDAVACAVASDWHVEEPVDSREVHDLNHYDLGVAERRSERFFQNLLKLSEITARDSKINTIYLALLGDFFSGWIHEELVANTLLAPTEAANFCKNLLASGIDFLLRESDFKVCGDLLAGNHGRLTKRMHFGDPTGTSLETFMYYALAERYRDNPRVDLQVANQAMVYRRMFERFNMRLIHGYEVKYGGGVGGITIPLRKAVAQWDRAVRADLTVLGHFHQLFDGGNFIANGSLIGYNTFAQAIKAEYEEPKQSFFLIHARGGGEKAVTAPIWVDDPVRK